MLISRVVLRTFVTLSAMVALGAVTASAGADEEFDVAVTAGHVTVNVKGGWHINKEYPWRLVIGDKTIDKGQFKLSDTSASVAAPKGDVKLKGGVCNGDQCMRLDKTLTVP